MELSWRCWFGHDWAMRMAYGAPVPPGHPFPLYRECLRCGDTEPATPPADAPPTREQQPDDDDEAPI